VPSDHPEELLRAVAHEVQADDDPKDEKSDVHVSTSRRKTLLDRKMRAHAL
jgi:hypothetical protein